MKPCNYLFHKLGLVVVCLVLTACGLPTSTTDSTKAATWRLVGVGDCPGLDEGETTPGSTPDDARAKAGYTAVCWDGETYTNKFHGGSAFCTYKRISYDRCKGGENPGEMYTTDPR